MVDRKKARRRQTQLLARQENPRDLVVPTLTTPKALSNMMGLRAVDILKSLITFGMYPRTVTDPLGPDVVELLCQEYHFNPVRSGPGSDDILPHDHGGDGTSLLPGGVRRLAKNKKKKNKSAKLKSKNAAADEQDAHQSTLSRPPVVTILGHVNHGKTTLLDALRGGSTAANEAGNITQHVSAFLVERPTGETLTFLDTPGHAAFAGIRQRGAKATDVAVLVVAADEGVQEQTKEAITYLTDDNVPMVVAFTKVDKRSANVARCSQQLTMWGVFVESTGGDVPSVEVCAHTKKGLDDLLDTILLFSEEADIKNNPDHMGEAVVLDCKHITGRGTVTTAVARWGHFQQGDNIVVADKVGKLRQVHVNGKMSSIVTASQPFEFTGVDDVKPGDYIFAVPNAQQARKIAHKRCVQKELHPELDAAMLSEGSSQHLYQKHDQEEQNRDEDEDEEDDPEADNARPQLRVILKADVHGSLEAIQHQLKLELEASLLEGEEQLPVDLTIISSALGSIGEADLRMANEFDAQIYGFDVPREAASKTAENVHEFKVLYSLVDHILEQMSRMLPPTRRHISVGSGEVLQAFEISVRRNVTIPVAGLRVERGVFHKKRNFEVAIKRDGQTLHVGPLASLKIHQEKVDQVGKGKECGLQVVGWDQPFLAGDVLECVEVVVDQTRKLGRDASAKQQHMQHQAFIKSRR